VSNTEAVFLILASPIAGLLAVAWARNAVLEDRMAHRTGRRISAFACGMIGVGVVVGILGLF
jgi:hypothetical protein